MTTTTAGPVGTHLPVKQRKTRVWQSVVRRKTCGNSTCTSDDNFTMAVPWLRRLVAALSLWTPGFNSRPVHVRFVLNNVALGHLFLQVLRFYPVNIIQPVLHTRSFIYDQRHISAIDSVVNTLEHKRSSFKKFPVFAVIYRNFCMRKSMNRERCTYILLRLRDEVRRKNPEKWTISSWVVLYDTLLQHTGRFWSKIS